MIPCVCINPARHCSNPGTPGCQLDRMFGSQEPPKALRPNRDETGLELAAVWAKRGTCRRRKVGCVLFDADGYQLSAGYNGPASGEPHCVDFPCPGANLPSGSGLDECLALHAELNALSRCADVRLIDTCYVTCSPCVTCVRYLLNTACRRIVFEEEYPHPAARDRWLAAGRVWIQLAANREPFGHEKRDLNDLLKRAVAAFNALPPEEQEAQLRAQRESWVRGEMELVRLERTRRAMR